MLVCRCVLFRSTYCPFPSLLWGVLCSGNSYIAALVWSYPRYSIYIYMLTYARACRPMPVYANLCPYMSTYARMCRLMSVSMWPMPVYVNLLRIFFQATILIPHNNTACVDLCPGMSNLACIYVELFLYMSTDARLKPVYVDLCLYICQPMPIYVDICPYVWTYAPICPP